jgi:fatty-acyl-CoA synthase
MPTCNASGAPASRTVLASGLPDFPLVATRSIAELILRRAEDDHIGLCYESDAWSWREVVRECAQRAELLHSLRRPGPFHVGVLLDNVPEYIFLLGGAALAGATVVGINPTRLGSELEADVRHTDCQIIVTDTASLPLLANLDIGTAADRIFAIESEAYRVQPSTAAHRFPRRCRRPTHSGC